MTGAEFIEIGFQAFVVGLVVGVPLGVIKSVLHNAFN